VHRLKVLWVSNDIVSSDFHIKVTEMKVKWFVSKWLSHDIILISIRLVLISGASRKLVKSADLRTV